VTRVIAFIVPAVPCPLPTVVYLLGMLFGASLGHDRKGCVLSSRCVTCVMIPRTCK
jgi:hypothetical protein